MFVLEGATLQTTAPYQARWAQGIRGGVKMPSCVSRVSFLCSLLWLGAACASGSRVSSGTEGDGGAEDAATLTDAEPQTEDASKHPYVRDASIEPSPADASVEVSDSGVELGEETREQYCAGKGAPVVIRVPSASEQNEGAAECTAGLASRIFQFGICSCRDVSLSGAFEIDALDSDNPSDNNPTGASVGTNRMLRTSGNLAIRGSLVIAGSGELPIAGSGLRVDGNFRTNSELRLSGSDFVFGRDMWVNSNIVVSGSATAQRDVYQTPGHTFSPTLTVGGRGRTENFTVPAPCACGDDDLLDVASIVSTARTENHNASIGLGVAPTLDMHGRGGFTLDCGRFYFGSSKITGSGNTIRAQGRTAIFVDGNLQIAGDFGVDVGTEGELDVFVSGNLILAGGGTVGSVSRPAALRFYVGGSQDIKVSGALVFAANVYAPKARIAVDGADHIYGAFFAGDFSVTGAHSMHYDRAIMRSDGDEECVRPEPDAGVPPPRPECVVDADCEPARFCEREKCTAIILE